MSMSMSMKGRESIRKSEANVISPGNNRQRRQDNTRQGMAQRERGKRGFSMSRTGRQSDRHADKKTHTRRHSDRFSDR